MSTICLELPEELKAVLKECAKDQDMSVNQLIRYCIKDYIRKNYEQKLLIK